MAPYSLAPYAIIWWLGQLFGFTSSMAQMLLISKTAPREERGFWTGMSNAAGNVAKFIGPLALSVVYGSENRAELVLFICGMISLGATGEHRGVRACKAWRALSSAADAYVCDRCQSPTCRCRG